MPYDILRFANSNFIVGLQTNEFTMGFTSFLLRHAAGIHGALSSESCVYRSKGDSSTQP